MSLRGLLRRVRAIEQKRATATEASEFWDRFEADTRAGIAEGRYCKDDMPVVVYCFKKWAAEGLLRLPKS